MQDNQSSRRLPKRSSAPLFTTRDVSASRTRKPAPSDRANRYLRKHSGERVAVTMELAFATRSIRATCESVAVATRALGTEGARVLRSRMSDLQAAGSILDLPTGRPVPLDSKARRM